MTMISRRNEDDVANLQEHGTNLALLIKGVRDAGVNLLCDHDLTGIQDGTLVLQKTDGTELVHHGFDTLIISRGYRPRQELKNAIEEADLGCDVLMAGDCVDVRTFFDAINEGAHVVHEALS